MATFFCAGNWKMNKSAQEAAEYIQELTKMLRPEEGAQLVVLPPALVAYEVAKGLKASSISWGGQNSYFESKGAFTGETSPQVLQSMGARFCLVGHSERRQIFNETDDVIEKKVAALQALGLTPILCVGETQDDRRWNRTDEVVLRQLRLGLKSADASKPLWLAYEPVWAIGTGLVATPDQVQEVHAMLRKALMEWSSSTGPLIPILYGGSVKLDNVRSLSVLENVNGFLIGGASLKADEFLNIYRQANEP